MYQLINALQTYWTYPIFPRNMYLRASVSQCPDVQTNIRRTSRVLSVAVGTKNEDHISNSQTLLRKESCFYFKPFRKSERETVKNKIILRSAEAASWFPCFPSSPDMEWFLLTIHNKILFNKRSKLRLCFVFFPCQHNGAVSNITLNVLIVIH